MKRRLFAVLFVLFAVILLTGCGKKEEEPSAVGSWEINKAVSGMLLRDEAELINKATAEYDDYALEAIGYLGSQVVNGTNYMYLCKATKEGNVSFKVVTVYEDLEGNASVKNVKDFNIEDYVNKDIDNANGDAVGGWTVSSECGESTLSDSQKTVFDKATEKLVGVSYKPVAVLADQIVAGKNYAVLAVGATVTENPVYNIYVLTIYNDVANNAEVTTIAKLNLADFN